MSAISRDEVAHLGAPGPAGPVTDEELDLFAGQLDVVLDAVARSAEARSRTSRRPPTPCR